MNDVDYTMAVSRLLRQQAGVARRRRDLKASFEAQDSELRISENALKVAAMELLDQTDRNAITVVEGEIRRATSTTTVVRDVELRPWLEANKPDLLRAEVKLPTVASLSEAGMWMGGKFFIDGEEVPGVGQLETTVAKLTISKKAPRDIEAEDEAA